MKSDYLKHITKGEEQFRDLKYDQDIFVASDEQSKDEVKSSSPLNHPDKRCPEQGDDETGYYSPAIYREEEYYGSPQNQSEDDAIILFTTSFIEEEVIRKCIDEISPDYLRSKEWELKWLAAKVRFRA